MNEFWALLRLFLRLEAAHPERFVSPVFFSVTLHILFFFAFGEASGELRTQFYVAQVFLVSFFALQLSMSRSLEPEQADEAFSLLRLSVKSKEGWFLAKFTTMCVFTAAIFMANWMLAAFFSPPSNFNLLGALYVLSLTIIGLSALGTLMAAMMLRVNSKQFIFALIYFPLTVPLLLASTQASLLIFKGNVDFSTLFQSWLGLLCIFDVIYLTLSTLLFNELVKA